MTDHSRAVQRAVYQSVVESSDVNSMAPSQINADVDDDGDMFVCVTQQATRPPESQLALLAAVARGACDHAHGSQALDENGKFTEAPEGESITVVIAGGDFLRLDVENPDEWHDVSQSRLMTKTAMQMERV